MEPGPVFEYRIKVMQEHIDELEHVNNVVYVQFMQDVADKHWHSIALSDQEKEVVWVVRRHEIDYLHPAVLGDELLIRTWTGEHGTVSWDRHYEIIRPADQKRIITAKSVWVLLDKVTGRPRRIEEPMLRRFL
ncbi:MAG: acyl-CoA thioesterase [Chitinophagaceae bacterium]|nr:acyl-CoA thioesterase [Chitinophagaceae bacterium]MEA3425788.1 thioesterase family protein [Bacteroidota bacterium]MCA6451705.1 acyl-CoA thioesterase [Chitinophagaceae bacterium]MCA6456498.1 acyl-CoA thioesterase [Chitinophagaceae bacterium]MCA6459820.1 acyl-CoA thioesterase [Chitinophagaceae bacterium]